MICRFNILWLCHFIVYLFLVSCSSNTTPEEKELMQSIRKTTERINYETDRFSFEYNKGQTIKLKNPDKAGEIWFDISDPEIDATIYCSYLPIDAEGLYRALEDSYHLAYSHVSVSDGISQEQIRNDSLKTYATIYDIGGQVATPIQFYVTDSTSHFLRGSVYYNKAVKLDSVAQFTKLLRNDVEILIESLRWKY